MYYSFFKIACTRRTKASAMAWMAMRNDILMIMTLELEILCVSVILKQ